MRRPTSPEEQALEELGRLKKRPSPGKKKRTSWVRYTAVALLAVACVGTAELTACRFFAPALYEELTEPVRETARGAARPAGGLGRPPVKHKRRRALAHFQTLLEESVAVPSVKYLAVDFGKIEITILVKLLHRDELAVTVA
ncbi:MAG: hypothetical protein K2L38_02095 [Dysosmobacter sp.]|nr:hypothetical protein [Dysosmobacter sp.]